MFVEGVGAVAAGPRPSNVGTPSAAVKFPSEPPPVRAFREVLPEFARQPRARFVQTRRRPRARSSGGRSKPPSTSRRVARQPRLQRAERRSSRRASAIVGTRTSMLRARDVGDDVGARAAGDHADVDARRRAPRSCSASIGENLARQLVDRAGALPGIEAGVRRHAVNGRARTRRTPFGCVLTRAAGQRRLQDEHRRARRASASIDRARRPAADFLVRGPEHDDARRVGDGFEQRAQSPACATRDAGLHVEDARAVEPAVVSRSGMRSSWPTGQTVSK